MRGWLRRMAGRLEAVRVHLLQVARRAGVDMAVPKALGSPWRDLLAALGAATAAVTGRFGPVGVLGPVTAWQVAVGVLSGGRLLAPGWPAPVAGCRWQHELPLTRAAVDRESSRGSLPGNAVAVRASLDRIEVVTW